MRKTHNALGKMSTEAALVHRAGSFEHKASRLVEGINHHSFAAVLAKS